MSCPNINTPEFKKLSEQLGSDAAAIYVWKSYGEQYPPEHIFKTKKELVKEFGIPESVLNSSIQLTPNQQKQQAEQLYSSYLQTTSNPTIEGFKQWNNRQQQINELFESNLELANSVYEAAGFNKTLKFYEGDNLKIDDKTYTISEKISSKELAKRNGLIISSNIPVYIVNEPLGLRKGGYDTVNSIIILSKNTDKETIHHELIHSVEYNLDKKWIEPLYQKVINTITEDSFGGFVSWNFKKSISEFIADALSKKVFRDALKKEGLLDEVDNVLSVYNQQLMPQQKQQAQQLYSQYLEQNPDGSVEQFKNWVDSKNNFDKELAQIIQDKLQKLYPEIKLNITNNPVWEYNDEVFNQLFSKKTKKIALASLISYTLWNTNAKLINSNIQYKDDVTTSYILEKIASDGYVYTDSNGKIINKNDTINTEAYDFLKNLWQKAGYPKIIIKSGEGKSRYNPVTNSITINIIRKDDVHGYIEIEKDKNGDNVYGISADLFIAEIAHGLQAAQGKMYVGKQIIDFIKSGFVYDNSYETEGTLEYEAHEEIEPQLVKEFENYLYEQTVNNKIIGQANIKAMAVLIDAINQKQDTLPHEYAHHYIAWFRDTSIVQEAIKKWGSEEALVQSIGEQVVKQKGEAYNWWNKFVKWIMNQFNSLSKLKKEELTQILTDAFLTRQDLNNVGNNSFQQFQQSLNKPNTNPILQGNQKPDVILPIGTSGSGKSTFIKSLPQENLVVIEPDAMRFEFTGDMNDKSKDKEIYEEAAKRTISAIKQGKQVVFDTTNLTKDKRLPFIEAIKKEIPNANIQYKLMELNPELAKQRIKNRLKTNPPVEKFDGFWNRSQVANQTNKVFLFGDNTNDRTVTNYVPSMTQAVIRGLPNAIGIDTKKDRGTSINSYLTDNDLEWFKGHVDTQIQKAKDSGKTIVVPADGIGTGKAMLKEKAPKLFKYLQEKLRELELTQGANVSDATIDRHAESYKQMLEDIKSEPISNFDVQQEQAKKFAELQERLDNKEFLEGAKNAFESSEELQNAYYEAYGIGKFRVTLGKELNPEQKFGSQGEPVVKKFEVLDEHKKVIGTVVLDIAKGGSITAHPTLTTIGKGYGQELYQIISLTFGAPIIEWGPHNISKSPEGKKLWNSLEKKGLAKAKYQWDDDLYLRGIDLSQEKQDALNAYTDYIARVSLGIVKNPSSGEYNYNSQAKDIVYHGYDKYNSKTKNQDSIHFWKNKSGLTIYDRDNYEAVILNIKNLYRTKDKTESIAFVDIFEKKSNKYYNPHNQYIITPDKIRNSNVNYDGMVGLPFGEYNEESYVVFEPEQIHILGSKQDIEGFKKFVDKSETQYQIPQGREQEEFVASEKTIRDLAARMSDRIGIPVKFESDRTKQYKGKLENGTAVVNLAYATLDTPIHEILGHPIIRAIKQNIKEPSMDEHIEVNDYFQELLKQGKTIEEANRITNEKFPTEQNQLYQNLLKELEYGKGKEVLDRVKRDYKFKDKQASIGEQEALNKEYGFDDFNVGQVDNNTKKEFFGKTYVYRISDKRGAWYEQVPYTLEEQQEEAIVELLGLYTADRLDKVKDGKLISLLKRLLKEIKSFMKDILFQKEVEIDKLPDNMTLGDIADLLAYSNSKLILPGNEVVYTTPDNQQFKTYAEASNHITELAKNVKDVDLSNVKINTVTINSVPKEGFRVYNGETDGMGNPDIIISYNEDTSNWEYTDDDFKTIKNISEKEVLSYYNKFTNSDSITNSFYTNNPINNFIEKNKEYEQSKEIIEEWKKVNNIQYNPEEVYSRGQEFVSVVGAYSDFDVNLMMQNLLQHIEDNQKAGGEFTISAFTKPVDKTIRHLEGGGGKIKFKIYPQSEDIKWAANTDVYSGSVWDASKKVSKDKKSELLGVSYTKYPSLSNVNAVQPNLAAIVDSLNHHHNELGIVLTGNNFRLEYDEDIPYTTKKIIDGINSILDQKYGKLVKPEIKKAEKKQVGYSLILDFNDGEISVIKEFKNKEEADKALLEERKKQTQEDINSGYDIKVLPKIEQGIQPTQTNETLKESIDSVTASVLQDKNEFIENFKLNNNIYETKYKGDLEYYTKNNKEISFEEFHIMQKEYRLKKEKEYTSQALINTKTAKLKEVVKKYPRSLIRSEVKPIFGAFVGNDFYAFDKDELPFQRISNGSFQQSLNKPNTNPILQGNQTNIEEIITQLEKDGLLEIDCKGKLKAEKGLVASFTKGGKWKVIKDLKGYPTHKQGGVDLTIGKNGVSIKNGNTQFTAKHGLVIPKN